MNRCYRLWIVILLSVPLFVCSKKERSESSVAEKSRGSALAKGVNVSENTAPKAAPDSERSINTKKDITVSRQNAITNAVQNLKDAVVGINVTQIREYVPRSHLNDPFFQFFFPQYRFRQKVKNLGSGFIVSPDGYILTNEHVVHGAVKVVVSLTEGKKYDAEIIGKDYISDVALLKIEGKNFPYCKLGDSDDIIIGEWVIALGNPFGLFEVGEQSSVTVGVVSSKNLDFGLQDDERVYKDMIQTDAAINPGNSGGPMANAEGEVIGMNTFIFTGSETSRGSIGLGFASPINRVKNVMEQLKKHGKVDRQFWTGLEVENLRPSVASYFGLRDKSGVIVSNVESDSPAEKAGLKTGDIIRKIEGETISSTQDIWEVLNNMDAKAGDIIHLTILRDGRTLPARLRLGKVK